MKEQLEKRLKELKVEFESGQKMLADLEIQQSNVRSSMLRISGAIQVLEELLNQETSEKQMSENTEEAEIQSAAGG